MIFVLLQVGELLKYGYYFSPYKELPEQGYGFSPVKRTTTIWFI